MADIRDQGQVNTPKVQADDGQSLQVSLRQDTSLSSVHTGSRQWYDPRIEAAPDEGYTQSPDISNSSENYNESVLQDGDSSVSNIELGGSGNNASSTKIVNNQAPIAGNGQEIIETNSPPLQPVTQPDTGDTFGNGFGGGGGAGGTSGSGGSSAAARSVGGGGGGGGTTTIAGASADDAAAGASGSDVLSVNDVEGAGGENLTLNINVFEDNSTSIYIILIQGMPDGATLSAGDNLGNGIWQVSVDELDGLSVAITEETLGNYNVTVTVINTETGEVVDSESFELAANDGADAPTLSVDPATGNEDSAIALDITAGLTDADETLSVTISDIPAGSTLSAGTVNPDGTVTLTAGELAGLTITPPEDFSGSFDLTVTATSTEGSDTASVSETLAVTVDAQADAPTLSVDPASGNEDSAIALDITAGLTDADETLSVTISDIPAGSTLSAGTVNPDGTVTLTAAELAGLTITPPEDFNGSFDLTVTATSSDGADTASIADTLSVTVDPVADAPAVTVDIDPVIEENVPSDLTITLDPLEADVTAEITVTGLPADATLSAGTQNPDGSWTLSEGDLAGLTLTVSTTVNISFTVDVTVTHTINGTTDSTTQSATVDVVDAGALPSVTVSFDGAVLEDAATPLDISVAVESGESVVEVTVDDLPAGTTLSAGTVNPDGSVTLTPGELAGLTLTPPDDYNGSLDFTVTAETTSGAGTETVTESVSTTVEAVAGTPTLTVNGASGAEDGGAITLDITAGVTDAGEGLEITISDIPAGATLSAGTVNPDGTVTLTAGELAGLTITPPEDFSGSFDLTVTATSSDGADTASIADTLSVTVDPVADAPTLSVDPASGNEDSAIALDITAGLTDADETLSVTISDIPAGATLSAGTVNPDGTVTLTASELAGLTITPPEDFSGSFDLTVTATSSDGADTASIADTLSVTVDPVADAPTLSVDPASGNEDSAIALDITAGLTDADETLSVTISDIPAGSTLSAGTVNPDGTVTLTAGELAGLTITPPEDFSGSFDLTVTATSSDGADTASIADTLSVTVDPVADAPTLSVDPASGNEDSAIALDITAGLTDADEILSVTISDIPAGSTLSAGTVNPDGTVTLTAAELAGLTITPPEDFSGSFDLTVTATSSDGADTASIADTLSVTVDPVADAPTLSVDPASGNEDSAIALDITAGLTDADETLSVTISDIPAGSTLSAGTVNPDGTVTLTAAELAGLTITPPEDFSGSFDLTVTATSSDGADTASIADTLSVTVDPVADAPTLSVDPASGNEDSAIALDITAGLTDADETLSVTISDIPAGSTLSAGTVNPDGTVTLTAGELAGLTITPPEDFSGSFDLTVTATSSDGADTASVADTLSVTVDPVADAPTLSVDPASGNEDSAIALDITAGLTDADETLSVTISDIPAGANLSAGTVNPDGTVTLTAAELAGLTITPPEDFSGSFDLTVTATSSDGADTATIADTLSVTVDPVADAPTLSVDPASGNEDSAIALDITAGLTDADETLSVTISDIPAGSTLSAGTVNPDGTVTLTAGELVGLTITPPEDFSGSFDLTVTATSSDGADTASIADTLSVTVDPVADAPTLSVDPASGNEDSAIALDITAGLTDADETLSVTISDIPAGSTLSAGTANPDGTVTLTAAELSGLTITPPEDFSGSFDLTVTATSIDGADTASIADTLSVTVDPVADAPTLSVDPASGNEDSAIALDITAGLTDADETLSVTISDIPAGSTLSAGTVNPDGTVTLTAAELAGLTITPPEDFNGSFDLTVTATSSDGADTASIADTLSVTVDPVADAPAVTVDIDPVIEENVPSDLTITLDPLEADVTAEITVTGLPADATLSAGTQNPDGSWTLSEGDLAGLTLTVSTTVNISFTVDVTVTHTINGTTDSTTQSATVDVVDAGALPSVTVSFDGAVLEDAATPLDISVAVESGESVVEVTVDDLPAGTTLSAGTVNPDGSVTLTPGELAGLTLTPPDDYNGSLDFTVTAETTSGAGTETVTESVSTTVEAVAGTPTLTVNGASGAEDGGAITLDITAGVTDAGEGLEITISDIPAGATLSAGTVNPDGTVTLTAGELAGLTITPPEDFSGSFDLTVTATSSDGADTASIADTLSVTVDPVADAPTLSVDPASGNEDSAIALDITAGLTDADETLSVTISDIPAGATLSAGTVNPDGTVTLTASELAGLTITPPEDFSGSFDLTVTATSSDGADTASIADTLSVTVDPVADAPTLSVDPASGNEDSAIALDITAGLTDADETLSVTISDIPAGSTLSAGTVNPDGTVTLTAGELAGLTITPPEDFSGSFDLTVTATSSDGADTASIADTLSVTVDPVADAPTLSVDPASGNEDSAIALDITAGLTDADEILSVTISDIPAGSTLSAGTVNPDGTVTLTAAELAGLTITPPEDFSGSFDLTVTATSSDGADTASIADTLSVTVDPVADAPTLSVDPASGNEDSAIALDITAGLTDADETLSVTISDIPAGSTLSAGTVNPDGTVTLTAAELAGLTITPPEDFSGSFDLTVTATSSDGADTASIADTLSVTVDPVADAPTLSVDPASGNEDSAIALDITAGLTDADETLSVTISDIPAGSTLSAGTVNPDGTVTLTAGELAGLTITPPEDFSGSFDLTVTATSTEGSDTASVSETLAVTVDAQADAPTLSVDPASGNEDSAIALDITAGLTDADETLSVTISDIPAGSTLSAGTVNPDGTVTLTAGELAGLTITPPADYYGSFDLTVTATSVDGSDSASVSETLTVQVENVADGPELTLGLPALCLEDTACGLTIDVGVLAPSEVLEVTIEGLPNDATLSAGIKNPDGSWTLTQAELVGLTVTVLEPGDSLLTVTATVNDPISGTSDSTIANINLEVLNVAEGPTLNLGLPALCLEDTACGLTIDVGVLSPTEVLEVTIEGLPNDATLSAGIKNPDGSWTLTQAELVGLTVTVLEPGDSLLTVTATVNDPISGTSDSTIANINLEVLNVAEGPTLNLGLPALCLEDTACGLTIDVGVLSPTEVLEVTIEGLPNDGTLSAGIKNPDGSWTLTQAELVGLTVTVLEPGDSLLTVTATVNDPISGTSDSTIANINLEVLNVAEGPTLNLGLPALCLEDTACGLTIDVGVLSPTEVLEVTIEGLPNDATLSAGIKNPDGSWTLTQAELVGLTVTVLEPGDSLLTVTATVNDPISGTSDSTIANINLEVLNVAEGPTLNLGLPALCLEDTACGLTIDVGVLSPTEVLEVTIEGLPNDGTLSAGIKNPDGSWTLTQAELVGLTVTVLEPGDSLLTVTATVNDPISGTSDSTIANINLEVLNVAEGPTLNLGLPALCLEDTACGLTIDVGVLAPSEVLEVTIEGLPNDATLSAGIKNPDGSWTLTQAELVGLTVTALEPGGSLLTVTATVSDPISGTSDSTIANINLEVLNIADAPTLDLSLSAAVIEDSPTPLLITVSDLALTEDVTLTIDGVDNGATLNAGTLNPDGTYTLELLDLVGLAITPDTEDDLQLSITATVEDSSSNTVATTTATLDIDVLPNPLDPLI
ncbi:Ig-like domain-containing protein [Thalassospira povalilytica]|uniref:Calcium-binding protein n=2 Tax=Thalassospira povalilytica TaxID=732237 RepID=A0A8I1M710_9PROT|nr:Ig-like domain-containing protein [Thalassospira povalilytica]MBN8196080.1 hypothetical protein [Thalassospira povalilytica]